MSIISAFWHYKLGLENDIVVRINTILVNLSILNKTAINQMERHTNVMIMKKSGHLNLKFLHITMTFEVICINNNKLIGWEDIQEVT